MKRFKTGHRELVELPEIDAFLAEIAEVCLRHGLSLSHEDGQGAFLVVGYDEEHTDALLAAIDDRKADSGLKG